MGLKHPLVVGQVADKYPSIHLQRQVAAQQGFDSLELANGLVVIIPPTVHVDQTDRGAQPFAVKGCVPRRQSARRSVRKLAVIDSDVGLAPRGRLVPVWHRALPCSTQAVVRSSRAALAPRVVVP